MPHTTRAALWMIGAILAFSLMAVAGREVSAAHDTFEIMLYRSLTGIVIIATIMTAYGKWGEVTTQRWRDHVVRNLAHFTGQNLWFFALNLIPLAQLFALEFTTPIWVILFAPLLLGEKITRIGAICAAAAFIGVLIVARPDPTNLSPGILAAAASAIAFGLTAILTRKLTQTETIGTIMLYLTCTQAVFGLICAGVDGAITPPALANVPLLILIGVAGLFAHFCLATALSLAPASFVMPIDFGRLPTIAVVGMLFYGEGLDIYVIIGAVLIFGATYANVLHQSAKT